MKIEWRPNTNISFEDVEFFDLYLDDHYQSIWVERILSTGKWLFVAWRGGSVRYQSQEFATMEEAKAHFTTYNVIRRLEGQK